MGAKVLAMEDQVLAMVAPVLAMVPVQIPKVMAPNPRNLVTLLKNLHMAVARPHMAASVTVTHHMAVSPMAVAIDRHMVPKMTKAVTEGGLQNQQPRDQLMEVVKDMVTPNLRTGAKHPMMVGLMVISNTAVS